MIGVAEDHPPARPAERLVGRRGDDLRVSDGRGVLARRDQAREVGHVDEEERLDIVRDLPQPREVEHARVRRRAGDDEPRPILLREPLQLVVVEHLVVLADPVRDEVVELAGEVHRRPVREMAALVERETEHGVARLEDRGVRGHVRLRAGVRLDVRVGRAEERLRAVDRELLGDVDPLAAAVVALAGQALRVLVGEPRPLGLHDGAESVVLAGDQLDLVVLSVPLTLHRRPQLRIDIGDARPAQS